MNKLCHLIIFSFQFSVFKVSKGAKIRNRYNQVPHLTQDTNGTVTNSQSDTTNESQEVSPFPAGDHKAHINRRAQRHSKHKTEQKHKRQQNRVLEPIRISNSLDPIWPDLGPSSRQGDQQVTNGVTRRYKYACMPVVNMYTLMYLCLV